MTGEELKAIRLEMQLSQDKLGALIGAKPSQISRWEHGHVKISRLYIEKIDRERLKYGLRFNRT